MAQYSRRLIDLTTVLLAAALLVIAVMPIAASAQCRDCNRGPI